LLDAITESKIKYLALSGVSLKSDYPNKVKLSLIKIIQQI